MVNFSKISLPPQYVLSSSAEGEFSRMILVIDTTGSMGDMMQGLAAAYRAMEELLTIIGVDGILCLIIYADWFNGNMSSSQVIGRVYFATIRQIFVILSGLVAGQINGGGDEPEASFSALAVAYSIAQQIGGSCGILLMTDAPYHMGTVSSCGNKHSLELSVVQSILPSIKSYTSLVEKFKENGYVACAIICGFSYPGFENMHVQPKSKSEIVRAFMSALSKMDLFTKVTSTDADYANCVMTFIRNNADLTDLIIKMSRRFYTSMRNAKLQDKFSRLVEDLKKSGKLNAAVLEEFKREQSMTSPDQFASTIKKIYSPFANQEARMCFVRVGNGVPAEPFDVLSEFTKFVGNVDNLVKILNTLNVTLVSNPTIRPGSPHCPGFIPIHGVDFNTIVSYIFTGLQLTFQTTVTSRAMVTIAGILSEIVDPNLSGALRDMIARFAQTVPLKTLWVDHATGEVGGWWRTAFTMRALRIYLEISGQSTLPADALFAATFLNRHGGKSIPYTFLFNEVIHVPRCETCYNCGRLFDESLFITQDKSRICVFCDEFGVSTSNAINKVCVEHYGEGWQRDCTGCQIANDNSSGIVDASNKFNLTSQTCKKCVARYVVHDNKPEITAGRICHPCRTNTPRTGMKCSKCKNFWIMAEALEDVSNWVCYRCDDSCAIIKPSRATRTTSVLALLHQDAIQQLFPGVNLQRPTSYTHEDLTAVRTPPKPTQVDEAAITTAIAAIRQILEGESCIIGLCGRTTIGGLHSLCGHCSMLCCDSCAIKNVQASCGTIVPSGAFRCPCRRPLDDITIKRLGFSVNSARFMEGDAQLGYCKCGRVEVLKDVQVGECAAEATTQEFVCTACFIRRSEAAKTRSKPVEFDTNAIPMGTLCRLCPGTCGNYYIRSNNACAHMQCSVCNTHWCWMCTESFGSSTRCYQHMRDLEDEEDEYHQNVYHVTPQSKCLSMPTDKFGTGPA